MKHLTHNQVEQLLGAADSEKTKLLFSLCYEHGLRVSECLALTPIRVKAGFLDTKPLKDGKATSQRLTAATAKLWEDRRSGSCQGRESFPSAGSGRMSCFIGRRGRLGFPFDFIRGYTLF